LIVRRKLVENGFKEASVDNLHERLEILRRGETTEAFKQAVETQCQEIEAELKQREGGESEKSK